MDAPVVRVDRVSKRFRPRGRRRRPSHVALEGVSFAAHRGEVVALTGPNGAGKSTLLRLIATLLSPDEGTVVVGGVDAAVDPNGVRRHVAYVPADDRGFSLRLSGWDNLEFFARLHHRDVIRARAAVAQALEQVGLREAASLPVGGYSSGMRQRLALARGIASAAQVLLLDEPFRSLDDDAAAQFAAVLTGMSLAEGRTIIAATHDLEPLAWPQVVHLEAGRIVPTAPSRRVPA